MQALIVGFSFKRRGGYSSCRGSRRSLARRGTERRERERSQNRCDRRSSHSCRNTAGAIRSFVVIRSKVTYYSCW